MLTKLASNSETHLRVLGLKMCMITPSPTLNIPFETGSLYVALAVLEVYVDQAASVSQSILHQNCINSEASGTSNQEAMVGIPKINPFSGSAVCKNDCQNSR